MWQVFACFKSVKDLKACGCHIELGHSSEKEYGLDPKSELYVAQQNLAKVMWQAALQIVRFRSLSHMHYIGQAPTCFVELLSTGDKLVMALELCNTMWDTIQYIEKQRHNFKELDKVWANIPWATYEVIREILVILSEFGWKWVPPHLEALLNSMFSSWGTSLVNELGFKEVRKRAKLSDNGRLHPTT